MSTTFGIDLLLNDKSPNNLTDSEFVDMYERLRLRVHCTLRSSDRTVIMVYKSSVHAPIACLEFGAEHALGTVKVAGQESVPMNDYLTRVSRNSRVRKFVASDGQTYTWSYEGGDETEWQCLNSRSYSVATYVVNKTANPTQGMVAVDEKYIHIAGELLVSLIIMRHILKYNL
ncbi:hypothetical protein EUX98_g2786 [Antrodiella citrinella]|uniref:DUF6593 domain-containing protein n=1 Tax=Antrodiella citrinella TaxID=2447956 RepID=A0A4S4N6G1_9APHY|nr:hypothetical protein EUX98_g2786 [Antrodiella citrinella]